MKAILSSTPSKRHKKALRLKKKGIAFYFWTGRYADGDIAYALTYDDVLYKEKLKEEKKKK